MLLGLMFMLLGLMFMDIPKALLPEERKLLHQGTRHRELQTEHVLCQLLNVLGDCHKIHLQNGDKYAVPTIGSQHKKSKFVRGIAPKSEKRCGNSLLHKILG